MKIYNKNGIPPTLCCPPCPHLATPAANPVVPLPSSSSANEINEVKSRAFDVLCIIIERYEDNITNLTS